AVATARYDDLDVDGSDRRIADLERRRAEILGSDDQLQALEAQIDDLTARLEETRRTRYGVERRQRELNAAHAELVDSEDHVTDRLQAMESGGRVVLTGEQESALA